MPQLRELRVLGRNHITIVRRLVDCSFALCKERWPNATYHRQVWQPL